MKNKGKFSIIFIVLTFLILFFPVEAKNPEGSSYEKKTIEIAKNKKFNVHLLKIDLDKGIKIITDTATTTNCKNDCPAKPLEKYIKSNNAFAGIHGSYFCAPDYGTCITKKNYYYYPFYNTKAKTLVNSDQLKWPTTGPLLVFTEDNESIVFSSTQEFKSIENFEKKFLKKVQAVIGNSPLLIKDGKKISNLGNLDNKQKTVKGNRGAIGVKGKVIYLVIAEKATVPDMADIMSYFKVDKALNLDGGGSTAMYYDGKYKIGPGRLLPNAIVFTR